MSSSSFHSAHSSPTHCYCGIPVAKKVSWTSANPGRRFACCKFANPYTGTRGCTYFEWLDVEMVEWQRNVTNSLLLEKRLLESDNKLLKDEVCNLEDQKANLSKELDKARERCSKLVVDLKALKAKKKEAPKTHGLNVWFVALLVVVVAIFARFA